MGYSQGNIIFKSNQIAGGGGGVSGADNGLHLDGSDVYLGGKLIEDTDILLDSFVFNLIGQNGSLFMDDYNTVYQFKGEFGFIGNGGAGKILWGMESVYPGVYSVIGFEQNTVAHSGIAILEVDRSTGVELGIRLNYDSHTWSMPVYDGLFETKEQYAKFSTYSFLMNFDEGLMFGQERFTLSGLDNEFAFDPKGIFFRKGLLNPANITASFGAGMFCESGVFLNGLGFSGSNLFYGRFNGAGVWSSLFSFGSSLVRSFVPFQATSITTNGTSIYKLNNLVSTSGLSLDTSNYVEVDINGTLYKLALVT